MTDALVTLGILAMAAVFLWWNRYEDRKREHRRTRMRRAVRDIELDMYAAMADAGSRRCSHS